MNFVRRAVPTAAPAPPTCADSALNQISLEYNYAELQQATRNFEAGMKLGSGSYGGVYKGELKDGTEVAIKVLDVPDEAGFEEEVKVLSKFRHPNLVILMGFARHGTQRSLVYEMLAGGDVHKRLHRSCVESLPFPWKERVSIALDAACGLSHLHHSSPKVFHRDIKTPNILLDKNGTAKMADFGLACLSHASAHRVKQASGTVGYACPLYVQRGVVTEGSEVYSFGMVLLELLTASPPAYMGNNATNANQIQYLANHINGDINIVLSLVDTKAQWTPVAARAIGDFALVCIKMREEERPGFAEIVRTMRAIYDGSALQGANAPVGANAGAARREISPHTPALRPRATAVAVSQAPPAMLLQQHCPGRPVAAQAFAHAQSFSLAPQPQLGAPPQPRVQAPVQPPVQPPAGRHMSPPRSPPRPDGRAVTPQALPFSYQQQQRAHSPTRQPSPAFAAPGSAHRRSGSLSPSPPQRQKSPHSPHQVQANVSLAKAPPSLFRIECIYSEGISLHDVPRDQRLILHRLDSEDAVACAPLPPLRVGRIFQTALFDALVADDGCRSTISREHFQVWAEEVPDQSQGANGKIPCAFSLTNFSGNGTHINDVHLQVRGERASLHDGDTITLSRSVTGPDGTYQARFITFRFDLDGCCLSEAEWYDDDSPRSGASDPTVTLSKDILPNSSANGIGGSYWEGDLAFVLEVCGPAVHEEVPVEQRRIAYSPPQDNSLQPHLYSSLIVGRAHQLDFWHEVLHNDAFNTLSRQHFEVQTWRSISKEAPFSFLVRNLSDVNPIHVRGGPEETTEEPPVMLSKGEQRHLLDGDEILLNLDQDHTFWLIFRDLTKSTQLECTDVQPSELDNALLPRRNISEPRQLVERAAAERGVSPVEATSKKASNGLKTLKLGRQTLPASVLRPPFSLHVKDQVDEISTAATAHDLEHREEEEDDDDDGMATNVGFALPKAGQRAQTSSATPSASSSSSRRAAAVSSANTASAVRAREAQALQMPSSAYPDIKGARDEAQRSNLRRPQVNAALVSQAVQNSREIRKRSQEVMEKRPATSDPQAVKERLCERQDSLRSATSCLKAHRQPAVQSLRNVRSETGHRVDARLPTRLPVRAPAR